MSGRIAALLIACLCMAGAGMAEPLSPNSEAEKRRAAQRLTFTDEEIAAGLMKAAFGAELLVGSPADRIRKFDGPVRVAIINQGSPDRSAEAAAIVADIRAHVQHLDIAMAGNTAKANVEAILVRERDLFATMTTSYGAARAKQLARELNPQCISSLMRDETFRIIRSRVIVVVDAGTFIFRDCFYEELLQALGPTNDTDLPWTMFNDDVRLGFFGVYDQHLMNVLYHPRVRPGTTRDELIALLPQILPEVRAFVAKANGPGANPEAVGKSK